MAWGYRTICLEIEQIVPLYRRGGERRFAALATKKGGLAAARYCIRTVFLLDIGVTACPLKIAQRYSGRDGLDGAPRR